MKKPYVPGIILGILVLAVGVGLLGNELSLWSFKLFFKGWWTLFIIVPCVISFFTEGLRFFNIVGTLFGVAMLLRANGILEEYLTWPVFAIVALIIFGIIIIKNNITGSGGRFVNVENGFQSEDDKDSSVTVFGTRTYKIGVCSPASGKYTSVFSSVTLDLRGADIRPDACLAVKSVFGTVKIIVDGDVRVEDLNHVTFGGIENKTLLHQGSRIIKLNAEVVFGGVEIV